MLYDTIEKRRKFVTTEGNIVTFKERQKVIQEHTSFLGKTKFISQIIIKKIVTENDRFQIFDIHGQCLDSYKSVDELIQNVDWDFMESAHS